MTEREGDYVDLLDRLRRAERSLVDLALKASDVGECARLVAKASGVALATSYVREELNASRQDGGS